MAERITFEEAYAQLVDCNNSLVDALEELRRKVKAQEREIDYLKRLSRAPGARRTA